MEKFKVSLEDCQSNVDGRTKNAMRVKELRQKAMSDETHQKLKQNPYLEIWDVDYYSTSDDEDNDSDKDKSSGEEDSEVDSEEEKKEDGNQEESQKPAEQTAEESQKPAE